ncbi:MAG: nucleoside monophosphate kinase [Parcubacteria group bacterium]|nr:nucleoside monophosphate kinase [Parcubacteria group bacterium]
MSPQTIIILGRSGSGKGTQAELLKKLIEPCLYVYTGDLFRELAQTETAAGRKVKEIVEGGGLPDEWLAAFLWQRKLIDSLKSGRENLIIDGSPRRLDEAREMDEVLLWLGRADIKVILVDITEDEAVTRLLKRGRKDDSEQAIRSRLEWFNTQALPAIEYYEKSGRLIKVDGLGSIEEIHARIKQALNLK